MKTDNTKPYGSIGNPILTDGIDWQVEYLHRLRSKSRRCLFFHRLGNYRTSAMEHPVDIYELIATDNSERWILAMSPYHTEMSNQAPEGLILRPFPRPMTFGVNIYVPNFPLALPDALREEVSEDTIYQIKSFLKDFPPEEWKMQKANYILVEPEILRGLEFD